MMGLLVKSLINLLLLFLFPDCLWRGNNHGRLKRVVNWWKLNVMTRLWNPLVEAQVNLVVSLALGANFVRVFTLTRGCELELVERGG